MYLYAVEYLRQNGYEQYEISNFARPGHASRHNLKYWTLGEYAGFGPGAYSDFGGVRYGYIRDLDRYIAGELVLAESEHIPVSEREMEYIMLRLRTTEGMNIREFENRFRRRFDPLARGWRFTPTTAWPSGRSRLAPDAPWLSGVQPDHRGAAGTPEPGEAGASAPGAGGRLSGGMRASESALTK